MANGVWVLTIPTPRPAPGYRGVASAQLWVAAGAASERAREHGCAHLLEHMVFKPFVPADAGPDAKPRDLANVIEQLGGDVNAYTSHDETVFHATAPADAIVEILDVMLAAVIGRDFEDEILAREREVVFEEIHQYQDDPASRSLQAMMSDLYGAHPYARPVLGELEEVRALSRASLRGWLRRQYRGERVLLVVTGPVEPDEIVALAQAQLGALPSAGRPQRRQRPKPPERAQIRVERADVQETYLRLGWIGGTALDAEGVALDVASVALGQGESSRLALARRRDRLVSDAYAHFMGQLASGTFLISAQAEGDAETAEAATLALLDEVEALAQAPLEAEELARARALLQSSLVYRRETVQGQAYALGYYATASGHLGAEAESFRILAQLDPEQIRQACARHLSRERAAITVLVPRDRVDARAARRLADRLRRRCRPGAGASAHRHFSAPERDAFGTWHARHRCGLRVVARTDPSVPVAAGWLVWPGGQRAESAREGGISSLTATVLNRGTASRDGDALAREIEGMAAVLDGFSGHNSIGLQLECLGEHLSTVLARAIDCATAPRFDPREIDEARRIAIADLEADLDDPGHLAYRELLATLYGRHPLGRDLRGTPESLARIDHDRVARNWARTYPMGRAVLALAGDIDLERVLAGLEQVLEHSLGPAIADAPPEPMRWPGGAPKHPRRPIERVIEREREQGQLVIGFPGLPLGDPEGAALDVLLAVLGGQAGRLFEALRERQGLVYQVGASAGEHIDGGHIVFYAAASQDKLAAARAATLAEIAKITDEGVGPGELDRAKRWLIGQFESGMQRRSRVASRLVFAEAYGLGTNYYLRYPERVVAVEREQLLDLARRLLDPRRQVTVIVRSPSD
nr:pitrilysin family protein [Pseudenhygromyxa sp. WMMC2535]